MTTTTDKVWRRDCERSEWDAFIAAIHSGEQFECDCKMYYYWLEVLPPKYMNRQVSWPDGQSVRADFGFAEGPELIVAFWEADGRFFGRQTAVVAD